MKILSDWPGGRVKVIYSDIDGSLLGPGGSLLARQSGGYGGEQTSAIAELLNRGIEIVPVSGRRSAQLFELCRLLSLRDYIAELGAEVCLDLGKTSILLPADGRRMLSLAAGAETSVHDAIAAGGAFEALCEAFPRHLEYHEPWHELRSHTHLLRGLIDTAAAEKRLTADGFPFLTLIDNGPINRRSANIDAGQLHAYHLALRGTGKAAAVARHMAERGYTWEDAIAIGDSAADSALTGVVSAFFLLGGTSNDEGEAFAVPDRHGEGWRAVVERLI